MTIKRQCKPLFFLLLWGLCLPISHAQRSTEGVDTILVIKTDIGPTYYFQGRKINLPIMEWFMQDYPKARSEISTAVIADQLSVASYSVGSLFAVTSLLVYEPNKLLGKDLLTLGGITLGAGIIFQIVSGNFKRKAVHHYNKEVKMRRMKATGGLSFHVDFNGEQTKIVIGF